MGKKNKKLQNENKDLQSTVSDIQQKLQKCQEENANLSQEITRQKLDISDLSKVSQNTQSLQNPMIHNFQYRL